MDQIMPDDAATIPSALIGPLTRMGERVAQLDGRVTAEIGALKQDTQTIRAAMHDTANSMQQFIAAERQCAAQLAALTEKMAQHVEQTKALADAVATLTADRYRIQGGWWAALKMIGVLTFLAGGTGAAFGTVYWLWQTFALRGTP